MQSDEVVWQIVNHGHCSYKLKNDVQSFCKNKYNLSGLCNRSSCPLASSQYATILEERGELFLCTKTPERAHLPSRLWQSVMLQRSYEVALQQITDELEHWPKYFVHKNKQRLTKLTQYLIRRKKETTRERKNIITSPARQGQRERRREAKAEVAARLESSIEKQLLERLTSGTYDSMYAYPNTVHSQRKMSTETTGKHARRTSPLELEYEHGEEA